MRPHRPNRSSCVWLLTPTTPLTAAALLGALAAPALAQATDPHLFIANEGNLEGSVSSLRIEPDGTLTFVDRVITGSRGSLSDPCPGCNTYAISLTPNGRFLATNHASGSDVEEINIYEVAPDGGIEVVDTIILDEGGLDIAWVDDQTLAVCVTDLGGGNQLLIYTYEPVSATLTLADADPAGSFFTSMAVHPSGQWIYTNDSFADVIRQFQFDTVGRVDLVDTFPIPLYGTALEISPDGRFLYASGGISAGGHAFAGYAIDAFGTLTALPGSPFTSPGSSPKGFTFTPDGAYLYVSHGSDATIHAFSIDTESGVPTALGFSFDVGLQGTLQGMDTLENQLFATDDSTALDGLVGVYSFEIDPATGDFTPPLAPPVPTQGIAPSEIAAWPGVGCPADLAPPFGTLNFFDLSAYLALFNAQDPAADLAAPFGVFNFFDLSAYLTAYNAGCP